MKTSKINSHLSLVSIVSLIILIILFGCKSRTSQTAESEDITVKAEDSGKEKVIKEVTDYPLPTSFEVTNLLIEAGASYILDLCNGVENVDKYINLKSKALNLGVYGADLSYSATYNQPQETMQYLKVSSQLIDELQIASAFNRSLVDRVEKNLDNTDSLIAIISDSFYDTYQYLNENEQDELSILVITGSWIEALYISTQISIISKNNEEIVGIITEQKSSLSKLLEILEPVSDDPTIQEILSDLEKIKSRYDQAGETFTPEQLDELIVDVESLRNKIIV